MAVESNFSYIIGPCKTSTPWHRPDPYNLTLWKEDLFNKISDFKNYKIWLLGSSIEGGPTWDVDFIITGELEDKEKLEEIMIAMIDCGFHNRTLVDVWWSHDCLKYIELGYLCTKMQLACQEVLEVGTCSGKNCLQPRKIKGDFIVLSNKIIKNGKILKHHKQAQKIHSNLWLCPGSNDNLSDPFFSQKHRKKIQQTTRNRTYPILLTPDTNFYEYIRWP